MASNATTENSPQSDSTPTLESIDSGLGASLQEENAQEEFKSSGHSALLTDASGDAGSTIASLQEENARLKERVKQLEENQRRGTTGSQKVDEIQAGLSDVAIGVQPESCQSSVDSSVNSSHRLNTDAIVADRVSLLMKPSASMDSGAESWKESSALTVPLPEQTKSGQHHAESSKELVNEGAITDDMIDWLMDKVSHRDWKPLVRKLGVTDNTLQTIEADNVNSAKEQRYKSYYAWRQEEGTEATVQKLLEAMKKNRLRASMQDFCKKFNLDLELELARSTQREVLGTRTMPEVFTSRLHEFVYPFLIDDQLYGNFLTGLNGCRKLSREQCYNLGYGVDNGATPVQALQWKCARVLEGHPDELEKRQGLRKMIRVCGKEVRDIFKLYVAGGIVGPARDDNTKLDKLPYSTSMEIREKLSEEGVCNWKHLKDWLAPQHPGAFDKVTTNRMAQWEKTLGKPYEGAENILKIWETTTQATVGRLYTWAVASNRFDIAKALE